MYKHARNLPANSARASAYKAMALAALRANSSLSIRLARYNHHMQRARLAMEGSLQEAAHD